MTPGKDVVQDKRLKKLEKKVKVLNRAIERRYLDDQDTLGTAVSTSLTADHFTDIAKGNDVGQRSGDEIVVNRFDINLTWEMNASATQTAVRTLIVYFPGAGDQSAGNQVLEDDTAYDNLLSFYKRNGEVKYKVLYDKTQYLSSAKPFIIEKLRLKHEMPVVFDDAVHASTAVRGRIYMYSASDQLTNTPVLSYYSRMNWRE